VHRFRFLGCQVEQNGCLLNMGTGAGVEIIVELVITIMRWGKGTRADHFDGWLGTSVSSAHTAWIISARSFSDSAIKLQRAWDCCFMSSSRLYDCWRS